MTAALDDALSMGARLASPHPSGLQPGEDDEEVIERWSDVAMLASSALSAHLLATVPFTIYSCFEFTSSGHRQAVLMIKSVWHTCQGGKLLATFIFVIHD